MTRFLYYGQGVPVTDDDFCSTALGTPNAIPYEKDKPRPFGINTTSLDMCDWIAIEFSFLTRWAKVSGTIGCRGSVLPFNMTKAFQDRCNEPGWLASAEKALKKFPLKCLSGGMRLSKFLEPETVEAILAGNYDFDPLQRTAGRVEPRNEKAQQAIADQQSKFQEENRAALAKKAATDKAKEKWSARAEMLTDEEIAELDRKYPESIIASLKKSADEPGAHHLRRKILISALCWCLELEHGKQVV